MTRSFDFMRHRLWWAGLSGTLILVSIVSLVVQNLALGLDFTTGTLVELRFPEPVSADDVRGELAAAGLAGGVVQTFGSDVDLRVRMPPQEGMEDARVADAVLAAVRSAHPDVKLLRTEFVGPAVGEELRDEGGLAMLTALIMVLLYIMFRFTGKFALGAVIALIHDVIIVVGMFSLFQWTFDLSTLAAVLAVIGYSLNDTIVVSDRIRENFRLLRRGSPVEVVNISLNQTLDRTLVTSLTTLLVLVALLIFGGDSLRGFALALTIGIVVGTYSSIYVASNLLLTLGIERADLLEPVKEGADNAP